MKHFSSHLISLAALSLVTAGGALLMSGCGGGANAAPIPKTNNVNTNLNRIAFSSKRDGNFEIYTVKPDGSDVQRVTTATGDDTKPAWSRDKTKLAFVSQRDGNAEIYVQNIADGKPVGNAQRITDDPASDSAPSWNSDGTQLVFQSNRATRDSPDAITQLESAIYVVSVNTKDVRRLTQHPGFVDQAPAWSPLGNLIVFQSKDADFTKFRPTAPDHLFAIQPNGENLKQLTFGGSNQDRSPSWNSNGTKVIYEAFSLFTLTLSNSEITNVRPVSQQFCFSPVFSPNNEFVICGTQGNLATFSITDPQKALTLITDANSISTDPSW